jgi:excisionase family DNA binding protein
MELLKPPSFYRGESEPKKIENGLLSPQEVAEELGMHVRTLYKRIRENTISLNPTQTSTARYGFTREEVDKYKSTHTLIRDGSGKPKKKKL